jgi:hypothetical protein
LNTVQIRLINTKTRFQPWITIKDFLRSQRGKEASLKKKIFKRLYFLVNKELIGHSKDDRNTVNKELLEGCQVRKRSYCHLKIYIYIYTDIYVYVSKCVYMYTHIFLICVLFYSTYQERVHLSSVRYSTSYYKSNSSGWWSGSIS